MSQRCFVHTHAQRAPFLQLPRHQRCRPSRLIGPPKPHLTQISHPSFRSGTACQAVSPVKEQWWTKNPQPNLLEAHSVQDLVDILDSNKDRLVLVDFFAPWCMACKSLYPKLNQLCQQNPHVVVVKLNWEEHKSMAKTLGVKVLPYFHAYHGSMGRVAAFSSSISKIQRLRDCMNMFGQPYCDIGSVNLQASLPEFDDLPTPSDATKLSYS